MSSPYDRPRGGGGIRILPILIGLVLIGLVALRGCQQGPFGRRQVVGMGPEQEAALGMQAYDQVLRQSEVVDGGPVVDAVKRVAERLIAAAGRRDVAEYTGLQVPKFQWQASVVRSNEINAFCLPGGKIVVYTGILPVAQTDSGLATVLGHEISHALAHHGAERMAQEQMVQIAQGAAAGAIADMDYERQREVLGVLGVGGKFGVLLPFSRKHESEADRIGLILMAAAGYDPERAIEFWQRMSRASRGGQPPEFMSTHPSHSRRIDDLENLLREARPFYDGSEKQRDEPLPGVRRR